MILGFCEWCFYFASVDDFILQFANENIDWNYVYYYLKCNEAKFINIQQKGGIPAVSKKQVEDFKIPIPPLEVQQEIVQILDSFDVLTCDISQGLPAEIAARRKQYEYYRNKLLTFKEVKHESL